MPKTDRKKTRGGKLLSSTADSFEEIAGRVGRSKTLVSYWASGERRPKPADIALLAEFYDIPPEAWETPIDPPVRRPATAPAPDVEAPSDDDVDVSSDATSAALNRYIRQALSELHTWELEDNKKADAIKKLTDAKVALDKSTGENALTLQRIVEHPEFKRVVGLIVDAIRPYPEALDAATRALRDA